MKETGERPEGPTAFYSFCKKCDRLVLVQPPDYPEQVTKWPTHGFLLADGVTRWDCWASETPWGDGE